MNDELEIWKEPAVPAWRNYLDVCLEEAKRIDSQDIRVCCPSRNTNPRPLDTEAERPPRFDEAKSRMRMSASAGQSHKPC
jgi:hypothetical protein